MNCRRSNEIPSCDAKSPFVNEAEISAAETCLPAVRTPLYRQPEPDTGFEREHGRSGEKSVAILHCSGSRTKP